MLPLLLTRCLPLLLLLAPPPASAQLRPRRVGVNPAGDVDADVGAAGAQPTGGAGGGLGEGLADDTQLDDLLSSLGSDPTSLLQQFMQDNPLLKGLADENPEIAEMMNDPEALKQKMEEVSALLNSEEGRGQMEEVAKTMRSYLTDPEKMAEGLREIQTNPMFKGIADSMPGMKELMEDPEQLAQGMKEVANMFKEMGDDADLSQLSKMMGGLAKGEGMDELDFGAGLREAQEMLRGAGLGLDKDDLDGGEALKGRVREQLANMLRNRNGLGNAEDF